MNDLIYTVVQPFKIKGERSIKTKEFILSLVLDLKWFKPAEAKSVLSTAVNNGLLQQKGDLVTVNFDLTQVNPPFDFKPTTEIITTAEESLFEKIIERIIVNTGEDKRKIIAAINQNQALLPQGATPFPNKHGTALGICISEKGRVFIALPGVPFEMEQIMLDEVIPYFQRMNIGTPVKMVSLKTIGIVESELAELITPELSLDRNIKLAYLPSPSGIELRVIATADTDSEAKERAQKTARDIEGAIGHYIFGYDKDVLEGVIAQLLMDNDRTLAVAESCTGGLLAKLITDVPGASDFFKTGWVAYSNRAKMKHLGVPERLIADGGAVSEAVAAAMAKGATRLARADHGVGITGIAGPTGATEQKPVGLVYISVAAGHVIDVERLVFSGGRNAVRMRAALTALNMLRLHLKSLT